MNSIEVFPHVPAPNKEAPSIPVSKGQGFYGAFDNWELLTSLERHHSEKHRSYSLELSAKLSERYNHITWWKSKIVSSFLCDFLS